MTTRNATPATVVPKNPAASAGASFPPGDHQWCVPGDDRADGADARPHSGLAASILTRDVSHAQPRRPDSSRFGLGERLGGPRPRAALGRDEDERHRARIRLGRNRSQHRVEGRHHSPVGNRRKCLVARRATSAAAGETPVAIPHRSV
jgi:hypothetical protein